MTALSAKQTLAKYTNQTRKNRRSRVSYFMWRSADSSVRRSRLYDTATQKCSLLSTIMIATKSFPSRVIRISISKKYLISCSAIVSKAPILTRIVNSTPQTSRKWSTTLLRYRNTLRRHHKLDHLSYLITSLWTKIKCIQRRQIPKICQSHTNNRWARTMSTVHQLTTQVIWSLQGIINWLLTLILIMQHLKMQPFLQRMYLSHAQRTTFLSK